LAGKAPLFQEVEANERSLKRYVDDLVAACTRKGVTFSYGIDVGARPELLAPFDRIVVATGARYRFGLAPIVAKALARGAGRWPGIRRLLASAGLRDWFYHRARRPTADRLTRLARPSQVVVAIGDAVQPGKSKPAIASAFEAALRPPSGRADAGPRAHAAPIRSKTGVPRNRRVTLWRPSSPTN
jgi:hypothetical protein